MPNLTMKDSTIYPSGMTHSRETYLNSPEQILKVLKDFKLKRDELDGLIADLKSELEQHFKQDTIPSQISANGLICTRRQNRQLWNYSERVSEIEKELKLQKEAEEQGGTATKKPNSYSWEVRIARR